MLRVESGRVRDTMRTRIHFCNNQHSISTLNSISYPNEQANYILLDGLDLDYGVLLYCCSLPEEHTSPSHHFLSAHMRPEKGGGPRLEKEIGQIHPTSVDRNDETRVQR